MPDVSNSAAPTEGAANTTKVVLAGSGGAGAGSLSSDLLTLGGDSQDQVDDPRADGWETEAFHRAANAQLSRIASRLLGDAHDEPAPWSDLLTRDATSSSLLPEQLSEVFRDEVFRVHRATEIDADSRPARLQLARLSEDLADMSERHYKFKPFRIHIDDDGSVTTRQYVHFSGRDGSHRRELNSLWRIRWSGGKQAVKPRITHIQLEQFEEATAQTAGGMPLLADCTVSLLGDDPSYPQFLTRGIGYWQSRLESRLGVYQFGHHGLAIGDINGDRLPDVYICQTGGLPNHLFLQSDDGTLHDKANAWAVDYLDNTRSALIIDLDNDQDQDLVLAMATGLLLLENDGHQFHPRARIASVLEGFSLTAADYDHDGLLDIYVCVYYGSGGKVAELPWPVPYFDATNGGANHLIHNDGNWHFHDVTHEVGLDEDNQRFSFAATWEDDDNDGDMDLLVVNDFGPNQLFRNEQGRFRDVAAEVGLLDRAFGMSATFGDYDHDGWMDIYVSNMFSAAGNRVTYQPQFKPGMPEEIKDRFRHLARGNSLFHNEGGTYRDVSVSMGVTLGRWSWGSLFADINNDSWEDLLVANGFVTGDSPDDL